MLALIMQSDAAKPTLIITPLAVLYVWKREIECRLELPSEEVCVYYGDNRNLPRSKLSTYRIILTNYETIMYPSSRIALGWSLTLDASAEWDRKVNGEVPPQIGWVNEEKVVHRSGPLYEVEYVRVVIDEAHNLRNNGTLLSLFANALIASFRWVNTLTQASRRQS